eukprot:6198564-Pleurochrysis_carterae.AAC.3
MAACGSCIVDRASRAKLATCGIIGLGSHFADPEVQLKVHRLKDHASWLRQYFDCYVSSAHKLHLTAKATDDPFCFQCSQGLFSINNSIQRTPRPYESVSSFQDATGRIEFRSGTSSGH